LGKLAGGVLVGNSVLAPFGYAPGTAASAAIVAGANLGIGAYQYVVTYQSGLPPFSNGESLQSPVTSISTTNGNQAVNLTNIPTGPVGTRKRLIYRTAVGGSTFKLLTTLGDNTTTTYSDTTADGSLGTQNPPSHPTYGGALQVIDAAGTNQFTLTSDG